MDALTAMCMLLTRLHFPTHLSNVYNHWGWKPERVSYICSALLHYIHNRWKHHLVWDHARLTPAKLEEYAGTISQQPELPPLQNCIGFIDGTKNPIARPKRWQRACYWGHKRHHCLAYQAVVMPDGIVMHIHGPIEGSHHDSWLYQNSRLFDIMAQHAYSTQGQPMCVYGDPGYRVQNVHLVSPWLGRN